MKEKNKLEADLKEIERVKISEIIVEKHRIRFISGQDLTELMESIKDLGQIHPIILNEDDEGKRILIAGFRRLMAMKGLGFEYVDAIIKHQLSIIETFDIEFHENWKRKNLTPYEISVAISERKEVYEELHPETMKGAIMKKGKRDDKGRVLKKQDTNKDKPERFTKTEAEKLCLSETTVKEHVSIGDEIRKPKYVNDKKIEMFKKGEVPKSSILKDIRKGRKKEKKEKQKKEGVKELEQDLDDFLWCKNCESATKFMCPECGAAVLFCKVTAPTLRKIDTRSCDKFLKYLFE